MKIFKFYFFLLLSEFNAINITPINTKTTPEIVNTFICELNKK